MKRLTAICLTATLLVTACATSGPKVTQTTIVAERERLNQAAASFDCGREPTQSEIEAAVSQRMVEYLKDPGSAQYQVQEAPRKGWMKVDPKIGADAEFGWDVTVLINAKNSYGGYIGFQKFRFLIRDGAVVRGIRENGRGFWEAI